MPFVVFDCLSLDAMMTTIEGNERNAWKTASELGFAAFLRDFPVGKLLRDEKSHVAAPFPLRVRFSLYTACFLKFHCCGKAAMGCVRPKLRGFSAGFVRTRRFFKKNHL